MPTDLQEVLELTGSDTPVHPASAVKSRWSAIVREVARHGEVIVTHHSRPEVVVLDVATYAELVRRARANEGLAGDPLQALAAEFDRRLARLNTPKGGAALRAAAAGGIGKRASRGKPAKAG